uniref:Uncharacterized protein n=1 Tax=Lutzomyia longipalpis TaxID=7200 RepID=A0A1B0CVV5_LUTLO
MIGKVQRLQRWRHKLGLPYLLDVYIAITAFYLVNSNDSLRLTEVRIPNHIVRDSPARLECHYDLDGEALYSSDCDDEMKTNLYSTSKIPTGMMTIWHI